MRRDHSAHQPALRDEGMIPLHPDEVEPGVWSTRFWSLVEPLLSLMDVRSRLGREAGNVPVHLPHAGSSTSWAIRRRGEACFESGQDPAGQADEEGAGDPEAIGAGPTGKDMGSVAIQGFG